MGAEVAMVDAVGEDALKRKKKEKYINCNMTGSAMGAEIIGNLASPQ